MIDRQKGLAALRNSLKDGQMIMLSEQKPLQALSTGIATLDSALGTGGFVRGSQVVLWGTQGAGKSALCYSAIGNLMQKDPEAMACIFDVERSTSPEWLMKFGVDPKRTVIIEEPNIEENINTFQKVMRSCTFDYIVIDSIGAMMGQRQFDGKDGKGGDAAVANVGGVAKGVTDWVNKANGELIVLDKMENAGQEVIKPVIIWINQVRANFNSMYGGYTMPGGYGLQHQAKVIIRLTASGAAADKIYGTINGSKEQIGTRVNCSIEKNKYAPKNRYAGYNFCYEESPEWPFGIDNVSALLDLALKYDVIVGKGAWYYFGDEGAEDYMKVNGRGAVWGKLHDDEAFYQKVYDLTMAEVARENAEAMENVE